MSNDPNYPPASPQPPDPQQSWGLPLGQDLSMPWGSQQPPSAPGDFIPPPPAPQPNPYGPAAASGQPQASPYGQPPAALYGQPPAAPYGQPPAAPYGQPPAAPYGQPPAAPYGQPASPYPPVAQPPQYGQPPQGGGYGQPPHGPGFFGQQLPEPTPLVPVSKGRSKVLSRMVPVVVGLGLVAGGGIYGVGALTGGAEGGAETATAAVESLFTAFENEDVLGIVDSLTPAERDVMLQPMQDIAVEMQRLGIASDTMDLAKIEGVDFEIQGLELKAKPLSEDVVAVYVTAGTLTSNADPSLLPVGDELARTIEDLGGEPLEDIEAPEPETDDLGGDVPIVAIKRNGRWGVSLGYTIAENARLDAGESLPDFGSNDVVALGGDTPEAAIEGMMDAIDAGDLPGMIGYLDPEEMAALYDYAPLFLDDGEEGADVVGDALSITSLDLMAVGGGDRRQVVMQGFEAEVDVDGTSASAVWDGECLIVDADGERIDTCELAEEAIGPEALGFDQLNGEFSFSVHKVGGRWYISPTRTVLDMLVTGLKSADDDTLQQLSDLFLGMGGTIDDTFETEAFGEICEIDDTTGECVEGF